jgi:hypothetical protein
MGGIGASCKHQLFQEQSEYQIEFNFFEKNTLGKKKGRGIVY